MKLKKISAILLSMSLATGMLAGCGSSNNSSADEKTEQTNEATADSANSEEKADSEQTGDGKIESCEVEFWHYMTGNLETTLTELTDEFNKNNEYGITVKLVNQGKAQDLQSKLTSNAAAGTLPDMAQAYNNYFTEYVNEVVHLDDFVANDYDNYEDIIQSYRDENSEYGFVSGLPFNKSTYVYFYNKTLFDELGLEAPKTWDDFYTIGEKVLAEKNLASLGYDDLPGMLEALVRQAGADYVTDDGAQFDNEKGQAALTLITELYSKGYARLAGDGEFFSTLLSNGLVAGYVGSSAGASYITADGWELGVAPLPAGEVSAANMAGTNLVMFAKDENKQKAAWEYMKYLTSEESTTKWAISTGYLPVRTSAFESEEYQAFMAENPVAAAAYAQSKDFFYSPVFEKSSDVRTAMTAKLEEIVLNNSDKNTDNDVDAQTALSQVVDAINEAVK